MIRRRAWIALAWIVPAFLGCNSKVQLQQNQCQKNDDCPPGWFCKKTAADDFGSCGCKTDDACPMGQICNSAAVCQTRSACHSNMDCDSTKFCDIASGACIERTACGLDVHCLAGTVCRSSSCVDGCRDDGDCPLYQICDRTGLTSTSALGRCLSGKCDDKTFCPYGDLCTATQTCMRDPNPNYCAPCVNGQTCGPPDFCLENSSYDPNNPRSGSPEFCGVHCDVQNDTCPNGYTCGGVILLTQSQCTNDTMCGGGGRRCVVNEGQLRGFCTCLNDTDCDVNMVPPTCQMGACIAPLGMPCRVDSDCMQSSLCIDPGIGMTVCLNEMVPKPCATANDCVCSTQHKCFGTGRACNTAADCKLSCQSGGCLLGAACAPIKGLNCPDVRP
jgi:hypothetical protein